MGLRGPRSKRPSATRKRAEPWKRAGLSRADRVVAFLESLPITKGILVGQHMRLLPHQREFVATVYAEQSPVRLAIQSLPRGNGKTGLQAGLCLAHLLGPEAERRGEVFGASIDRLMAGVLFAEVVAIIEAVPTFAARTNVQRFHKKVEVLDGDGKGSIFETLSADVRRAHGLSPTLFVFDEFGQVKTGELLDNLVTAQGKRKRSLGVVISTQAARDEHPMSVLIDDAERGSDPSVYLQLLTPTPDDNPFDPDVWARVNPALGVFLDAAEFEAQAARAQRVPTFLNRFLNLRLNMRVEAEAHWLPPGEWLACAGRVDLGALQGERCFGGLDLGSTRDLTSFALFWPKSGALAVWSWCPEGNVSEREITDKVPYRVWCEQGFITATPGKAIDKRAVAATLAQLTARYKPTSIAFDRWGMAELQQILSDEGITLPLAPFGQGFKDMGPAVQAMEARVLNGRLVHPNNPVLTWAVSNVTLEVDAAGNRKPSKRRSTERIDPAVAACMAIGIASQEPAPRKYDFSRPMAITA
jgi:phage terminase large subunit-like protein